jgi:hypothetical protein
LALKGFDFYGKFGCQFSTFVRAQSLFFNTGIQEETKVNLRRPPAFRPEEPEELMSP